LAESSGDLFRGSLLRLAAPAEADVAIITRWSEDADYMRALDTDFARPRTIQEIAGQHNPEQPDPNGLLFHLRTLDGDRLIGFVALHSIEWNNRAGQLSIGIGEADFRGKGYGSEALRLILRYAFDELNLDRVGLDVISNNERAIRAYEKVGFRPEGALRKAVLRDGRRHDRLLMGILREEWLGRSQEAL